MFQCHSTTTLEANHDPGRVGCCWAPFSLVVSTHFYPQVHHRKEGYFSIHSISCYKVDEEKRFLLSLDFMLSNREKIGGAQQTIKVRTLTNKKASAVASQVSLGIPDKTVRAGAPIGSRFSPLAWVQQLGGAWTHFRLI